MFFNQPTWRQLRPKLRLVLYNLLSGAILLALLIGIVKINPAYQWTWQVYVIQNLQDITSLPNVPYEQRLAMKLGEDYQFLLFLRDATPMNAVIYYPSNRDFLVKQPGQEHSPFSGKLNDKLTAIRVLYPRRVVTEDEYGRTEWSNKLTHVAIVNGQNLDKLPYRVPPGYVTYVLPMDSTLLDY